MNKRDFLSQLAVGAGIIALPLAIEAEAQREIKPVTADTLAKSLLTLSEKATKAGLVAEAKKIRKLVAELLQVSVVPCDTDIDCMRKNGGDGYGT